MTTAIHLKFSRVPEFDLSPSGGFLPPDARTSGSALRTWIRSDPVPISELRPRVPYALSAGPTEPDVEAEDDETVALKAGEVGLNTEDFIIRTLARHLKGHAFHGFVADLLRTMGYRTSESKIGPDEGIDILRTKMS